MAGRLLTIPKRPPVTVHAVGLMVLLLVACADGFAGETSNFNLGVRLQGMNWAVTDKDSQTDNSKKINAKAGAAGVTWQWRRKAFYLGGGLAGGTFTFDEGFKRYDGLQAVNSDGKTVIDRTEFDLVSGYQLWRPISVFVNLKAISNKWEDDYTTTYTGLGIGVNYHINFNDRFSLFGSAGLLPMAIGDSQDDEKNHIGNAKGGAAEVGGLLAVKGGNTFTIGVKSQYQKNSFDNDAEQVHATNAVQFRYYHTF